MLGGNGSLRAGTESGIAGNRRGGKGTFHRGSVVGLALLLATLSLAPAASGSDWPKYLHDLGSSGFTSENLITTANASELMSATGWPVRGGGAISTQPVVANNLVYWGTWDGYEHATPLPGRLASGWATNLGQTSASGCPFPVGVASTGQVASVTLTGQTTPRSVLFVGGGGNNTKGGGYAQLYALDALTGSILWHTPLGRSPNHFLWSSPAVYTYTNSSGATATSVYVGVSSFFDCPLVQGRVVQLDATSGQIQNIFDVVPSGCTGGSVWGSPTIDQSDGSLYVATGNHGSCSSAEPYPEALVKLRASDLSVLGYWQIPAAQRIPDGDFGSTPTLFSGTVSPGGTVRSLVGVVDKNGIYYVFDRSQVSAGPIARLRVDAGGGSISPSAWDGTTLYVAGGTTTINGTSYAGSLRAFNPNNLSTPLWQRALDGPVDGAVTAAPGLVVVGEGHYTVGVDASNGNVLLRVPVNSISSGHPARFWGAPSFADGTLFEGDTHGYLYAYTRSSYTYAWGDNEAGQFGNAVSQAQSFAPVPALTSLAPIKTFSAGRAHTLVVLGNGTVMASGDNGRGELGNGCSANISATPVPVSGLSGATAVAAGYDDSFALLSNGTVMAWGNNEFGQLGIGSENATVCEPVAVKGLTEVKALAAGTRDGLALLNNGTVMAWGQNGSGQLGNGTTEASKVPVPVSGLSGVVAIAAGGSHNLALLSDGEVRAWGNNNDGQLGNETNKGSDTPVTVKGLSGVSAISARARDSYALLSNGHVMAWGDNRQGQLGVSLAELSERDTAGEVSGISSATGIAAGENFALARLADGSVDAWGADDSGQLGDGTNNVNPEPKPGPVKELTGVVALSAGSSFSLAYSPPPVVTKLTPAKGPVDGGTTVNISGKNFTWATAVSFGSQPATGYTVNSSTSITAVSPAEPAGTVDVTVTTTTGTSTLTSRRFMYFPAITSLTPNTGSKSGGTTVTVRGTGFAVGSTRTIFKFGTATAPSVNCTSSTECTVVSPAHAAGKVDVRATVTKATSPQTSADVFTYS